MTCHPASHCATGLLALVHAQSRYLVSTIEADEAASLRGPYLGILRTYTPDIYSCLQESGTCRYFVRRQIHTSQLQSGLVNFLLAGSWKSTNLSMIRLGSPEVLKYLPF